MKAKAIPKEKVTQQLVCNFMKSQGYVVEKEKRVNQGRIDIVVKEYTLSKGIIYHIVECKRYSSLDHITSAIGQLRRYAQHYKQGSKLYICTSDSRPLSNEVKKLLSANPDILFKVFSS